MSERKLTGRGTRGLECSLTHVQQHDTNLPKPQPLLRTFPFKMQFFCTTSRLFLFLSFFRSLWNAVARNELITRPAWLWMVAASPRIKAANPQMQAQSNATERSFWHIRAKLILVWTYFGCFEALLQQACLWRSSNLCWVRSKSKTENQQPMKLRLAGKLH